MEEGELQAHIKYIVHNGEADVMRRDIYDVARAGKLTVAMIALLQAIRNEEAKQQLGR